MNQTRSHLEGSEDTKRGSSRSSRSRPVRDRGHGTREVHPGLGTGDPWTVPRTGGKGPVGRTRDGYLHE